MGKFFAILFGLGMMAGGVYFAIYHWWEEFTELVFGSIPPILFFVGLIAFIAGISSIKDARRANNLDEEALSESRRKAAAESEEKEIVEP